MNWWLNVCPNCQGTRFQIYEADDDISPSDCPSVSVLCTECGQDFSFRKLEIMRSYHPIFPNTVEFVNGKPIRRG